jgi:hypothetical protein
MIEKEIREDSLGLVNRLLAKEATANHWFILAQSLVVAVYEVAAQLAHMNETGEGKKHEA